MKKITFFIIFFLLAVGTACAILFAISLLDFDLSNHNLSEVSFTVENNTLSGTLILPRNVKNPPIALIIHGDGAQDRFSSGAALPLINTLVDAGIGVFTWDKAGVGESTGNWLDQTMENRANEALAARQAISDLDTVEMDQIGFLGFSQAGWVLPKVANKITPAFTVIVGGAVSWRDQGTYYNRVRMINEGLNPNEISQILTDRIEKNDVLFAEKTEQTSRAEMNTARLRFVANAYWEDSTNDISGMRGPVLAMWGEEDLNVDAQTDSSIFREQLSPLAENRSVVTVPNATHGLLRADLFNYQLPSDWPWYLEYVFLGMGRDAHILQSLDQITEWIKVVVE